MFNVYKISLFSQIEIIPLQRWPTFQKRHCLRIKQYLDELHFTSDKYWNNIPYRNL